MYRKHDTLLDQNTKTTSHRPTLLKRQSQYVTQQTHCKTHPLCLTVKPRVNKTN